MKYFNIINCLLFIGFLSLACGSQNDSDRKKEKNKKEISFGETTLSKYKIEGTEPTIVKLKSPLVEISGLALTKDARLFAHGDEKAVVFEIDHKTGEIVKSFEVGDPILSGDFEGIAIVDSNFYMVSSNGNVLGFKEGDNKGNVTYSVFQTGLGSKYDVEGLCYYPATNSLLLACKGYPGNEVDKNMKAIYSFSLTDKRLSEKPVFLINLDMIKGDFNPSGIEFNPYSKTFFVIAANGNSILEISEKGEVINQAELPKKFHKQPEGITFLPDKRMVLSNEGGSDKGYLAIYKYNE